MACIVGRKFCKILIFLNIVRNDIFEFSDDSRLLRNAISALKIDFRVQNIEFTAFSEN